MKYKLLLTLILSIFLSACSDFPSDGIVQGAILQQQEEFFHTIYELDSFDILNTYTLEKNNEDLVTIDYKAKFKIKYDRSKRYVPDFYPDINYKKRSVTLVKRGENWYID